MKKNYIQTIRKSFKVVVLLLLNSYVFAQIPVNAMTADPSATSVTQVPSGSDINGSAVIQFKFKNEAALVDMTGKIPDGSVRITITFPSTSAFTSVNSIPKFIVEDSSFQPNGIIHLKNNAVINEQEVLDLLLNVNGVTNGAGTITYNVSRTEPFTTANTLTTNDSASASFNTSTVLPVKLKSFDASINNCVTNINWQSASEDNLKNYSLEYSYDGSKYIGCYDVNAKGNNSAYNMKHVAIEEKVFYRLKMFDFDGTYEYSRILPFNAVCNKIWAVVYPNPIAQTINVNVSTLNKLPTTAVLYNILGKKILSQLLQNGTNKINVTNMTAGIYTLIFSENTGLKNSLIIIK